MEIFSTDQVAKMLGTKRQMVKLLREYGLLPGAWIGHGYRFADYDFKTFWDFIVEHGIKITTEDSIRIAAQIFALEKKSPNGARTQKGR